MFHFNERKNCVSLTELKHVTLGNDLVLLLSCLREGVYFLARGMSDDAIQTLESAEEKSNVLFGDTMMIVLYPANYK